MSMIIRKILKFIANRIKRQNLTSACLKDRSRISPPPCPPCKEDIRVLFVDDAFPDPTLGAGFPRSNRIFALLSKEDCFFTFFPLRDQMFVGAIDSNNSELICSPKHQYLPFEDFLKSRRNFYTHIIVSRPHNMKFIWRTIKKFSKISSLIYDAEALWCMREINYRDLIGSTYSKHKKAKLIKNELKLGKKADLVFVVSEAEKQICKLNNLTNIRVLSHAVAPRNGELGFRKRAGFLFIGRIQGAPNPNEDALRYFCNEIFPSIKKSLDCNLSVAGIVDATISTELSQMDVKFLGPVQDVQPLYDQHKIFIAPTRFSAGIPLKIIEAAANGLPIVCTPLLAEQLGWKNNSEVLVAKNAQEFTDLSIRLYQDENLWLSLREKAFQRIKNDYSEEKFKSTLREALSIK